MGETFTRGDKVFERDIFGGEKEVGVIKSGGPFNDTIVYHDSRPDAEIETDWSGTIKDIVGKDKLSELIEGRRQGTRIEPDASFSSPTGQKSYEWTQELGGAKVPKSETSGTPSGEKFNGGASSAGTGEYSGGYGGGGGGGSTTYSNQPFSTPADRESKDDTNTKEDSGSDLIYWIIIILGITIALIGDIFEKKNSGTKKSSNKTEIKGEPELAKDKTTGNKPAISAFFAKAEKIMSGQAPQNLPQEKQTFPQKILKWTSIPSLIIFVAGSFIIDLIGETSTFPGALDPVKRIFSVIWLGATLILAFGAVYVFMDLYRTLYGKK